MSVAAKPLAETTHKAITVLAKELGIVETVRFLTQFGTGFGDYTRERDTIFRDIGMDEIVSEVRLERRRSPAPDKGIPPARKKRPRS